MFRANYWRARYWSARYWGGTIVDSTPWTLVAFVCAPSAIGVAYSPRAEIVACGPSGGAQVE